MRQKSLHIKALSSLVDLASSVELFSVIIMSMADNDSDSGHGSIDAGEDKALAAFSLVKYENPEVIDTEDGGEVGDEESCEEVNRSIKVHCAHFT